MIPSDSKIENSIPIDKLCYLAFNEGKKKKPVYEIHKWWARRLGSNFRMFIKLSTVSENVRDSAVWELFYKRTKLQKLTILDPFMGGGTSIIEASKCGAKTIGIDIDPVAWFITKKEIEKCDIDLIKSEFYKLENKISDKIKNFYKTKSFNGDIADVITYFWVDRVKCKKCKRHIELHPHLKLYENRSQNKNVVFCRDCHKVYTISDKKRTFTCANCKLRLCINENIVKNGIVNCYLCKSPSKLIEYSYPGKPTQKILFALEYEYNGKRFFKAADKFDINLFTKAKNKFIILKNKLDFPRDEIPIKGRHDRRPVSHGYKFYFQLFNERQLLGLSIIYKEIKKIQDRNTREFLMIAFSDSLASNNMLCSYAFAYRKLTPLFGLHAYRIITRPVEGNLWGSKFGRGSFTKCFNKMLKSKMYCYKPYEFLYEGRKARKIFTGESIDAYVTTNTTKWKDGKFDCLLVNKSSENMDFIESKSVDLILTDPPYYDNLSYSELSDFFYVWLKKEIGRMKGLTLSKTTPYSKALFVNNASNAEYEKFSHGLQNVFEECSRVLKDSGIMIFTFHHSKPEAWKSITKAIISGGFEVTNVFPILSENVGGFHSTKGSIKWDAVFCCRHKNSSSKPLNDISKINDFVKTKTLLWTGNLKGSKKYFKRSDKASFIYALRVAFISTLTDVKDEQIDKLIK